ncbi:hypothetical protein EVAR_48645_1 [Eumeta japonica]|uniref:Uncharacterized protein n=1 Tax=Eumeta variegata TaxID=151549 RepID=A0A4C1XNV5_EUMVA|nr:hypothetical protein EVAR_48645_1 [Eumeta japonica]
MGENHIDLKYGCTNLTDYLCEEYSTAKTEYNISAVQLMIETDDRVTYHQIRIKLGIVADPRGRARSLRRRRQVEGLRRRLVLGEGGKEAQLKLDTQPTAGGRTLVDADRIKAARIGDPRWRRSDRARLPTADQAIHASDGSSQGSIR